MDGLLKWLTACGIEGARVGSDSVPVMVFADDIAILVPGSIAQVQRALHLVDRYLQLFGVSLEPSK